MCFNVIIVGASRPRVDFHAVGSIHTGKLQINTNGYNISHTVATDDAGRAGRHRADAAQDALRQSKSKGRDDKQSRVK